MLNKLVNLARVVFRVHRKEELKKCECPCHEPGVYISHFRPCCKYTDQKRK